MTEEKVHISQIRVGDTILHEEKLTTVGRNSIRHCSFMGTSLFGDSYCLGTKKVTRVHLV